MEWIIFWLLKFDFSGLVSTKICTCPPEEDPEPDRIF
jgi:hypothetical protein